ncbi:LANO_0A01728g1_1 [Lachancea nothofagi CBS 11611]|uniref:LANO_0A01728g1_1 n=1 Tax=Lachancea nothofagi CBS 11611 TaxID=1266666 RepID=A0A1G4INA7_9SACH|nr:LANO_0A01728g1_1 [Lachancea nothofagi CBS 11611]
MDTCVDESSAKRSLSDEIADAEALTPPSSTLRKSGTPMKREKTSHPLSPELSSPIRPQKARKTSNRSDTPLITTRSSNSQTLEELIEAFTDEKRLVLLQDPHKKPPFSYAMLIGLAILQSEQVRLTLSQIYQWITYHFPFYKLSDYGWQNSIRHNLSLNEAFIKGDKSPDGKGHYWQVKTGCEGKFFKGGQSDDEIRVKLSKLCSNVLAATAIQLPTPSAETLARDLFKQTAPENAKERRRMKGKKLEEPCQLDISSDEESDDEELQGPGSKPFNLASSPSGTEAVFIPYEARRGSEDQDAFIDHSLSHKLELGNMTDAFSAGRSQSAIEGCFWNEPSLTLSPAKEIKKYSCSFNTNFETSPHPKTPVLDSFQGKFGSPEPQSTGKNATGSLDLLKTPQLSSASAAEFSYTPRDINSMRKWRTPTALVDDFTRSPVLINSSRTPMLLIDQSITDDIACGKNTGNITSNTQSRKFFENMRYSSGLFGVDVCSVWKRAVESRQDNSSVPAPKNKSVRLDTPFQASNK